jgi:CelD/BcsL family acetyltransferase involved in cellulose biosynthesis
MTHNLHRINPLEDPRWRELVEQHPQASVFHSIPWLRALRDTYGYRPVAFTWAAPGEQLRGAMLFCEVDSWLTGRRLVSLPFSDHCQPLLNNSQDSRSLIEALESQALASGWRYIEIRPLNSGASASGNWHVSANYTFHQLDLGPDLDTLFQNFHQSSTQRKIRRAKREGLTYREGSSESQLSAFYRLLVMTRKRHHVPPQPRRWFRNLMNSFGEALKIRLAIRADQPVAGMLTIRHKNTVFYKYGGSDARFHNLGGMHLLYWNSIQDAKSHGVATFDFGRSDADQPGLITFKSRWGARVSPLNYYRFALVGHPVHAFDPASGAKMRAIKGFCSLAPNFVLPMCGNLLYKHIG